MLAQGNHLRSKPPRDSGTDIYAYANKFPDVVKSAGGPAVGYLPRPNQQCVPCVQRRCRGWLSGPPKIMIQ